MKHAGDCTSWGRSATLRGEHGDLDRITFNHGRPGLTTERLGTSAETAMTEWRWELQRVESVAGLEAASAWSNAPAHWLLEHDPRWSAALLDTPDTAILLASRDGRPVVSIFVHQVGLALELGELSLGSIPVRRHVLTGGLSKDVATSSELADLLIELGPELGPSGVIFLQGVRSDEPLRAALDAPQVRRLYHVLPHGAPYQRCRIRLEGDFDAYLATLGRGTRKDLKKTVRVFRERVGEAAELQVVMTPSDLEAILPELERLSGKTYQSRLLGMGIAHGNFVERQLRFGVSRGIGRVDLLRVRGEPISFQVGYTYNGTFHATQTGYDPTWADLHPGIVHLLFMIDGFCRNSSQVRYFDLMYGQSLYKTRLSNTFHEESQFYLIPRTARGWLICAAFRAVNWTSGAIGRTLEKLRLKDAAKKLLRRFA